MYKHHNHMFRTQQTKAPQNNLIYITDTMDEEIE
jgi:hypothetical protein